MQNQPIPQPSSPPAEFGANTSAPANGANGATRMIVGAPLGESHLNIAPTCPPSPGGQITSTGNLPVQPPAQQPGPQLPSNLRTLCASMFEQGAIEIIVMPDGAADLLTALTHLELDYGAWVLCRMAPAPGAAEHGQLLAINPPARKSAP